MFFKQQPMQTSAHFFLAGPFGKCYNPIGLDTLAFWKICCQKNHQEMLVFKWKCGIKETFYIFHMQLLQQIVFNIKFGSMYL